MKKRILIFKKFTRQNLLKKNSHVKSLGKNSHVKSHEKINTCFPDFPAQKNAKT